MHTSRPIEVEGRFLGVAVTHAAGQAGPAWRFIATDPVVEDLDGASFPSPAEAQRVAGLVVQRSRQPAGILRRPLPLR
ncbi:hypothetical protein [Paracraurococcus lichenis]|uniref:Uncharacterized protein n=1 Tax=Paracraurococcus lichenis TaxID=3064888 RepID=A0ABT9DVU4_9PROT|nr:hypothetical protein [Paracraurococcus sp. LOR1-02]MDO9708025.1 hypothetical protein [Paracraurococcus sp. LOR1-02]